MKTSSKILISVVCALVIGVGVYGGYEYLFSAKPQIFVGSVTGSTFNTAKFAGVTINAANTGSNGTSTSILNTDASDRYVSGFKVGCNGVGTSQTAYTGAGLATWQIKVGTTTTAAPATFNSFAAITNGFTLATTTTNLIIASSTTAVATSSQAMEWPTNTYMTFSLNATNTAVCTVGVDYSGS